jgi:D-xylose transport system permease protein
MAATGTISLGIIMVLLLGEIDLSAGSVSGLAAVVMTILSVRNHVPVALAIAAAVAGGMAIGILHGLLFTRIGVPSFVATLAGLIAWQGLMLYLLGKGGTINLPFTGFVAKLSDTWLPQWLSWVLAAGGVATWAMITALVRRQRLRYDLPVSGPWRTALPIAVVGLVVGAGIVVLSADRGVPLLVMIFGALVVVFDLALRHTVIGRYIFAVGGNAEAARRAGINVAGIRVLAFAACSTLAAIGGLLAASRLAAVNQSSGGSDILLMAIAAAVIGGASLFGGRGRTYAALLGILVIQSIANGMLLLNVDSSVRFMVTGIVLAVAVAIDALARRAAPAQAS